MAKNIQQFVREILEKEIGSDVPFSFERPEVAGRGDYSSNIALVRAKKEKRIPMAVAEDIAIRIKERYPHIFHSVEAAPPGFVNVTLDMPYLLEVLRDSFVPAKKHIIGRASVEFISANPTGPMHIGNARGGPIGDVVANLLAYRGYKVTREYYHNDAGAQIERFASSLWHWYLLACKEESTLPEDGYQGAYMEDFAREAHKKWGTKLLSSKIGKSKLVKFTLARVLKENMALIKKMGIKYDKIVVESEIAKEKTPQTLAYLEERGLLVKKEGATWFSPKGPHMEDREAVVIKSDGTLVYFANDIAYHRDKFSRADLVVDELGEGHEGHIAKLRAVADVFGFPQDRFKVVVHGQVTLKKDGAVVSMAKRKGNFVTAREVLDAVGTDAFRFFMLQYDPRSGMQFDVTLAREQSKQNPVYYVQYAHARASGILRKKGFEKNKRINYKKAAWELLDSEAEIRLIKDILSFTEIADATAEDFAVQRLTRYAYELARSFTHFYETATVIGEEPALEYARLALVSLVRDTFRSVGKLLGVSMPYKM